MTLRLRLIIPIVLLVTAGLGLFGLITYSLYARSEYASLDHQLQTSAPIVRGVLSPDTDRGPGEGTGSGGGPQGGFGGGGPGDQGYEHGSPPPILVPFGAVYDGSGRRVSALPMYSTSSGEPKLPAGTFRPDRVGHIFTTGSVSGSTEWRVLVSEGAAPGEYLVVAVPTTNVENALQELVLIESAAALGLLLLLSVGSWVVLRRGLRPLEHMAVTARRISAGDLSQRVAETSDQSEVGQLALALNAMLTDIEDAFAARDATEERLRQFLADASHELRTPLTSIQGFSELARLGATLNGAAGHSEVPGRSEVPDGLDGMDADVALNRIEEQAGRMRLLIEDLLLLARLDQTRPAGREPVDLTVLAADACTDAAAIAPDRAITFEGPEPVIVLGDESHLRQAIANLVMNAVRHTPAGSPVEVSSRRQGGEGVVQIRDHGPGLDPASLDHVFDRFWRADASRATGGHGLGLSIVEAIAREHGGRAIGANHEEGGAVFSLLLPMAPAQTSAGVPLEL